MSTTILPPPNDEERIELDAIMTEARRAPRAAPPSIAPWDEPRMTPALRSAPPPPRTRWIGRASSAALAIGLGVTVSAALSQLSRKDERATTELVTEERSTTSEPPAPAAPSPPAPTAHTPEAPSTVARPEADEAPTERAEARVQARRAIETRAQPREEPSREPAAATPEPLAPPPARGEPPNRAEVRSALERVRAGVAACGAGRHGRADVRLTVHPSGRVQAARVEGTFAGTTQGSCIARAVRDARFPAFAGEAFDVAYPYDI
jgi:hypothetical protein